MNITKKLIEEHGLTPTQIMYKTGASVYSVIRWQKGKSPDKRYRAKLERILEQQEEKKAQREVT